MVHRRVKRSSKPARLGSHNRSWIWGRHVVWETICAGRWPILELAISTQLEAKFRQDLRTLADRTNTPLTEWNDDQLTQRCRAADHQGCAALMSEFPYLTSEQLLAQIPDRARLIVLDRLQDPFNFGAILRTVDGLGLDGIVIGAKEQSGVNSQVARSSAGAVNHVPIAQVEDLSSFVKQLIDRTWQVWGATERGAKCLHEADFHAPLVLIIGNEGTGISPALLSLCTQTVRIPLAGQVSSLNAAVAAGIVCYELVRGTSPG